MAKKIHRGARELLEKERQQLAEKYQELKDALQQPDDALLPAIHRDADAPLPSQPSQVLCLPLFACATACVWCMLPVIALCEYVQPHRF